MSNDRYLAAVDGLERSAADLHAAVDRLVARLAAAREQRLAQTPLIEVVSALAANGGRDTRRAGERACAAFIAAITEYRATTIRMLVDHEGVTLSEIARLTGVSRQMVGRLYRAGAPKSDGSTPGH
jgi:DNA invertase Pin-like site-specific DNA recombinase